MTPKIAQVVVNAPVEGPFDYAVPPEYRADIAVGMRVLVSFSRRQCVGIVTGFLEKSAIPRLNNILALLDEAPVFSADFLKFSEVFALRFGCSRGEALTQFLPGYLRKPRKFMEVPVALRSGAGKDRVPRGAVTLLFDGGAQARWDALAGEIRKTIMNGQGVLCLAPDAFSLEEALPRLEAAAGTPPVLLSDGTEKEEFRRWESLLRGRSLLAAGFISAAFVPLKDIGLVVLLDEESPSYKHDQSPFYHARDAVLLRAALEGFRVILASSAPSVEAWKMVEDGKAELVRAPAVLPPVKFLDLTNFKMKKGTFLSEPLRQQLAALFNEGGRALLYIQAARGIRGVVEEMRAAFPGRSISGYDRDSSEIDPGADILVCTLAVLRQRASYRADISVVLDMDWEFHKADYRAAHGAFALTRYLRLMTRKALVLQTRHMAQELLHFMADDDPSRFYARELDLRRETGLPPFCYMVALVVRSSDPQLACGEAKILYDKLVSVAGKDVLVLEPEQDRTAILRGKYRYCVMAQARSLKAVMLPVKDIQRNFRRKKDIVLTVNVNP
jgi:primosomal protein N'